MIAETVAQTDIIDRMCQSWRHQTVSKKDKLSQPTAEIAEGNNKSRVEWGCEYGADRAKQ